MVDELVINNINLIYYVLKKMDLYDKADTYYDDGLIGLINASRTFDISKGYAFGTYASKCIRIEILKAIQVQNYLIRKANYNAISIEKTICINSEGSKLKLIDILPDEGDLEEEIIRKEKIDFLYQCLNVLDEEQQFIIKKYFGLAGEEKLTLIEIGKILKTSPQMVKYKMRKGFKIIKKIMEDKYENN